MSAKRSYSTRPRYRGSSKSRVRAPWNILLDTRMTPSQTQLISSQLSQYEARYADLKARGLKLDMTRGKPSSEQLDLANGLLTALPATDYKAADGTDTRNYGGLDGLPEMKAIFAEMLETSPASVIVGGASSLTMM